MKENRENLPQNLLIILSGPTGTGKSRVALELAKIIPAEIVNADSRQFYREINIGTAKPSQEAFRIVPHHLFSFLSLTENFTVFDYRRILEKLVPEIWKKNKAVILVGGSGLYIRVLLKGIFDFPPEKKQLQQDVRKELLAQDTQTLYNKLKEVDPVCSARIHQNDRLRIVRAIEVWSVTGIPMSQWQTQTKPADFIKDATIKYWILEMPRENLYNILDLRTEKMIASGWLEETKKIVDAGLKEYLKEKAPIGYMELCEFLDGKTEWNKTVEIIKRKTRNYARRQITWFRKEKDAEWINVDGFSEEEIAQLLFKRIVSHTKDDEERNTD